MSGTKSRRLAIGDNIAQLQRFVEQKTERQALSYKPSEVGKVWLQVDERTAILVPEDCNREEYACEWRERHE